MMYFLGVDGGGSKTEAILAEDTGRIIGYGRGGPANINYSGKEGAFRSIVEAVDQALGDFNTAKITTVVFCIPSIKEILVGITAHFSLEKQKVRVYSDILNSFYGALAGRYGVAVLSGTGSFVIGIKKGKERDVVGGWGPLIGDPGSGHWIGVQALKAVARVTDGMGEETCLTRSVCDYFRVEAPERLKGKIDCERISQIAPLVKEAAHSGDRVAESIVKEAASHLAEMALTVIGRMEMDSPDYYLTLTGGISNFGDLIWTPFTDEIKSCCTRINIITPRANPALGTILLAMKANDLTWNNIFISNLCETYREVKKDVS